MSPTLEVAINLIESSLKPGQKILGVYESLIKSENVFFLFRKFLIKV